jgi:nucleoside 2-deoxyribosyltransferase
VRRVYLAGPPYADEYRRRAAALVRETGWEPVDPMRRDYRRRTEGSEERSSKAISRISTPATRVLAAFVYPDEGTAMEAWYAHSRGKPVVAYTGGVRPHPWTVYVVDVVCGELEQAVRAFPA